MVTQASDIAIVLSGGTTNTDPEQSLGGTSSASPIISGNLNNLFDDVTSAEGKDGAEEFRCVYIYNDGETTIYNCKIWITAEVASGANIELGVHKSTEKQRVRVIGTPTSGSITFEYDDQEFTVNYDPTLAVWATNFQTALNDLRHSETNVRLLREVRVTIQSFSGTILFDIDFGGGLDGLGQDDFRNHAPISWVSDTLSPASEVSSSILSEGGPINEVAEIIEVDTQVPSNITFYKPTALTPIVIPKLQATEGFPLWIRRVVSNNSAAVERDGVTWKFRADSLDPLG